MSKLLITKRMAKTSEGDNRDAALRKRKIAGKKTKSLRAGLKEFWAKRSQ